MSPWEALSLAGKILFATIFVVVGVLHFVKMDFFMKIMPPYLPLHREIVLLSGAMEIVLGILLLIPSTTRWAGWGLVALLIAVFPANIHVFLNQSLVPAPALAHLLRLILQGPLILWAYCYTR